MRAGLSDLVTIETSKGGFRKKENIEKYKLVMSNTARRTSAILMYLAGVELFDIMKVTCTMPDGSAFSNVT